MKLYGLDLDEFSSNEIIDKVGVTKFSIEELLWTIWEGSEGIKYALERRDYRQYNEAALRCSPNACELFRRLSEKGEQCLSHLVNENHFHSPTEIKFWIFPDMIISLYESLKNGGYYASTT